MARLWWLVVLAACSGREAELEEQVTRAEAQVAVAEAERDKLERELNAMHTDMGLLEDALDRCESGEPAIAEDDTRTPDDAREDEGSGARRRVMEEPPVRGKTCAKIGTDRFRLGAALQASDITAQVKLRSSEDELGEPDGLRLSGIEPDSLGEACGFQNGDVLHTIDGEPILSLDDALAAYDRLRGADGASFEVTRRGRTRTWEVLAPR